MTIFISACVILIVIALIAMIALVLLWDNDKKH